ncbi:MAG: hypothetical protein HYV60_08300 [Planctomycetia bacterium]|nr:hypothetical protein [Planctomycetia bacterium]
MAFAIENTPETRPYRFAFLTAIREMLDAAKQRGEQSAFVVAPVGSNARRLIHNQRRAFTTNARELTDAFDDFESPDLTTSTASEPVSDATQSFLRTIRWSKGSRKVFIIFTGSSLFDHEDTESLAAAAIQLGVSVLTIRMAEASTTLASLRNELVCTQLAGATGGACALWDADLVPADWFSSWLDTTEQETLEMDSVTPLSSYSPDTVQTRSPATASFFESVEWIAPTSTPQAVAAGWVPAMLGGITIVESVDWMGPDERHAIQVEAASLRNYLLNADGSLPGVVVGDAHCFFARPRSTTLASHFRERGLPSIAPRWEQSQRQLASLSLADCHALVNEVESLAMKEPQERSQAVTTCHLVVGRQ